MSTARRRAIFGASVRRRMTSRLRQPGARAPSSGPRDWGQRARVGGLQLACGVGHMTIPNGVALVMRHSNLGHDALFYVLAVTNAMTLAIVAAVVAHLRQNFQPAKGSIREAQLAAKREL